MSPRPFRRRNPAAKGTRTTTTMLAIITAHSKDKARLRACHKHGQRIEGPIAQHRAHAIHNSDSTTYGTSCKSYKDSISNTNGQAAPPVATVLRKQRTANVNSAIRTHELPGAACAAVRMQHTVLE